MHLLVALIPLLPLGAAVAVGVAGWRTTTAWAGPLASVAVIGAGALLGADVLEHGALAALGSVLRADSLSAFMVIVIGTVSLIANTYGVSYITGELDRDETTAAAARSYGVLAQVFVAAMLVVVLADNLGVLWVAIEATTVATVLLVGHRRTRASLEASWKYVVIGSVGVGLALLGTVLVYFASRHVNAGNHDALNWSYLVTIAPHLNPGVMRLAIGLIVLGFGTKAGLAPMHSWLPDTYSQAPAPVAALMAGVLSSTAAYALLRYKVIADGALGRNYTRGLLLAGALLSLLVAASLLLAQRDYKRLLAYSSIEHMGLIALGIAIGTPLALTAVLLHILGHGIAKCVLFCTSGEISRSTGTTKIDEVAGLLTLRPLQGTLFGVGLIALAGFPPFAMFASELGIARSGVSDRLGWAVAVALVLVLVTFIAIAGHALKMLLGEPSGVIDADPSGSTTWAVPLVGGLVALAVLGLTMWPIERLIDAAAKVVTR